MMTDAAALIFSYVAFLWAIGKSPIKNTSSTASGSLVITITISQIFCS